MVEGVGQAVDTQRAKTFDHARFVDGAKVVLCPQMVGLWKGEWVDGGGGHSSQKFNRKRAAKGESACGEGWAGRANAYDL